MTEITGYDVTRGALAAFRRKRLGSLDELLSHQDVRRIAILEDITNAANVGSIFRCAAALGIDAILVTPGCCDPLYRRAVRVSMGAVFKIPWTYIGTDNKAKHAHGNVARNGGWSENGIPALRGHGFEVVALALHDDAVSIDDPMLTTHPRIAIVLGTEGEGLSDATIERCDRTAIIPMRHGVDSLNVSVASAIAFWSLCD